MQREHADPTGVVDRLQMRVAALLGDHIGDVVDGDDTVEKDDACEHHYPQSHILQHHCDPPGIDCHVSSNGHGNRISDTINRRSHTPHPWQCRARS